MNRAIHRLVAVAGVLAVLALIPVAAPAARAARNGAGQTPLLGWCSWSFVPNHPTAAAIEAQARALKSSGLARIGYQYVNLDDYWYKCPGRQGPDVDRYGRWVTDPAKFPPRSGCRPPRPISATTCGSSSRPGPEPGSRLWCQRIASCCTGSGQRHPGPSAVTRGQQRLTRGAGPRSWPAGTGGPRWPRCCPRTGPPPRSAAAPGARHR